MGSFKALDFFSFFFVIFSLIPCLIKTKQKKSQGFLFFYFIFFGRRKREREKEGGRGEKQEVIKPSERLDVSRCLE